VRGYWLRVPRPVALALTALALAGAVGGCGSDEEEPGNGGGSQREAAAGGGGSTDPAGGGASAGGSGGAEEAPSLTPPPCPPDASNCAEASGQIIYVERVDPDGDGDAHFVLLSGESITAPGLTVVDVRPELRPSPLPEPGDLLAASGPVFRGSYDQKQIQADALRVGN